MEYFIRALFKPNRTSRKFYLTAAGNRTLEFSTCPIWFEQCSYEIFHFTLHIYPRAVTTLEREIIHIYTYIYIYIYTGSSVVSLTI